MFTKALYFLAVVFICSGGCAWAQMTETPLGIVTGHLFCSDTHAPARFANVTIESIALPGGGKGQSYAGATDIEGVFQIAGVKPGDYYIVARFAGYLSPLDFIHNEFEPRSALQAGIYDDALVRIAVAAGRTLVTNLTLQRGASLGGTVRYDDGSPASGISVSLYRRNQTGAWKQFGSSTANGVLAPLGVALITDDRGRFYHPSLPAGTYTLKASLPSLAMLPTSILGTQSLDVKLTPGAALDVFSGDKYTLREAAAIKLVEGQEVLDQDLTIPTHGLHRVSGRVVDGSSGETVKAGQVRLLDAVDKELRRETPLQNNGSFSLENIVNGSYLIEIKASMNGKEYVPSTTEIVVDADRLNEAFSLSLPK